MKKFPIRQFVDYFSGVQGAFEDTFGTVPTMFLVPNLFPMSKGTVWMSELISAERLEKKMIIFPKGGQS